MPIQEDKDYGEGMDTARLRAAHDSFQSIVQNSPFGVYTVDAQLRLVQVSAGGQKAFANVRPLIGRDLGEVLRILWPEPFPTEAVAIFRRVLETGESYHAPSLVEVRADIGDLEAYDWKVDRITLPDGLQGLVCHFYDLSERQRFEALLSESEGRYRTLFNSMLEGYCLNEIIYDAQGRAVDYRVLEVNPAFESQSGLKDVKGRTASEISPDIASNWVGLLATVAESGVPARLEHFDATVNRWFEVHAYRVEDAGGKKVAVIFRDITAYETAQRALSQSEERFRSFADSIPHLAWIADVGTEGKVGWFNKGWLDFTGTTQEQMRGSGWKVVHHPDHVEAVAQKFEHHVKRGLDWEDTFPLRGKNGQYRWFLSRMKCISDEAGNVVQIFGTNTDVTRERQLEEDMRQATAELSEAHRRKDEFLATLAHELRNPLAPMRNGIELMKRSGGQAGAVEQARAMMERQLTQMVRLVDDLMDVSRISQGKLELRKDPIPLVTVLNSAIESSQALIEKKRHKFIVKLPEQPLMVDADLTRLAQVFQNLLNNAAKYSDQGGEIHLTVECHGTEAVVTVKDTGVGIAADQLPRIFEIFTQVKGSLDMSQGGLGIGLSLVKRLVDMHGGRVEARSGGLGQGSEFVVHLPLVNQSTQYGAPPSDEEPTVALSPLKILVVDDNQDGADSLSEMLSLMGNVTSVAYDGQQGVDMAREFRPDVILFDIGMPKLNGYEACRLIRAAPWGRGVVLIAVTGWGQDEDRNRTREAGFDYHLVKPVDPQDLMTMLSGLSVHRDVG